VINTISTRFGLVPDQLDPHSYAIWCKEVSFDERCGNEVNRAIDR